MKKFFCLLIVLSLAAFGAVAVLASIPHAHGEDFDHSQNETCPVHQIGMGGVFAAAVSAAVVLSLIVIARLQHLQVSLVTAPFYNFSLLRAPPAIS